MHRLPEPGLDPGQRGVHRSPPARTASDLLAGLLALLLAVASACTSHRSPGSPESSASGSPTAPASAAAAKPTTAAGSATTESNAASSAPSRPACLASLDLSKPARPPFYRVTGRGGAELLLLGTVHVGPPTGWKLSPALASAISSADEFAMEVDLRSADEEQVSNLVASLAMLDGNRSLVDVLAPETIALLDREEASLGALGFPAGRRKHMKPWFVAVGIAEMATAHCGLPPDGALEFTLLGTLRDRPLRGLETIEEQLHFLDDLGPPLQDLWLRESLARIDEAESDLIELIEAWQGGDEASLAEIARQGVAELPALKEVYDILLGGRNRHWLESLRPLLDDAGRSGDRILVAVGALHLVGPDSLVDQLRRAGYAVAPLDHGARLGTP